MTSRLFVQAPPRKYLLSTEDARQLMKDQQHQEHLLNIHLNSKSLGSLPDLPLNEGHVHTTATVNATNSSDSSNKVSLELRWLTFYLKETSIVVTNCR